MYVKNSPVAVAAAQNYENQPGFWTELCPGLHLYNGSPPAPGIVIVRVHTVSDKRWSDAPVYYAISDAAKLVVNPPTPADLAGKRVGLVLMKDGKTQLRLLKENRRDAGQVAASDESMSGTNDELREQITNLERKVDELSTLLRRALHIAE